MAWGSVTVMTAVLRTKSGCTSVTGTMVTQHGANDKRAKRPRKSPMAVTSSLSRFDSCYFMTWRLPILEQGARLPQWFAPSAACKFTLPHVTMPTHRPLTTDLLESRNSMNHSQIRILGIPMDLGQQRRGVDMGPSAVRYAGLYERLAGLGCQVEDDGNVLVPGRDERTVKERRWTQTNSGGLRHLPEVVSACQSIYEVAKACSTTPEVPIFLGGDHSIAIGTVGGHCLRRTAGADLDRRARRFQYARNVALRKHPWHAGRRAGRAGPS